MSKPNLRDLLVGGDNVKNAKKQGYNDEVLVAGDYDAKVIGFTEEETYQFVTLEINGKRFNFFYNYYIKDTTDLDGNTIDWIKALSTIEVTEQTNL